MLSQIKKEEVFNENCFILRVTVGKGMFLNAAEIKLNNYKVVISQFEFRKLLFE